MVVVTQAQPDTALYKALNPRHRSNDMTELLRSIEFSLRWLRWTKTTQAKNGLGEPRPHYWPWEREEAANAHGFRGDPIPWEQVLHDLGHDQPDQPDPTQDKHSAYGEE